MLPILTQTRTDYVPSCVLHLIAIEMWRFNLLSLEDTSISFCEMEWFLIYKLLMSKIIITVPARYNPFPRKFQPSMCMFTVNIPSFGTCALRSKVSSRVINVPNDNQYGFLCAFHRSPRMHIHILLIMSRLIQLSLKVQLNEASSCQYTKLRYI